MRTATLWFWKIAWITHTAGLHERPHVCSPWSSARCLCSRPGLPCGGRKPCQVDLMRFCSSLLEDRLWEVDKLEIIDTSVCFAPLSPVCYFSFNKQQTCPGTTLPCSSCSAAGHTHVGWSVCHWKTWYRSNTTQIQDQTERSVPWLIKRMHHQNALYDLLPYYSQQCPWVNFKLTLKEWKSRSEI